MRKGHQVAPSRDVDELLQASYVTHVAEQGPLNIKIIGTLCFES